MPAIQLSIIHERGLRKVGYSHLGSQRQGAGLSGQSLPMAPAQKSSSLGKGKPMNAAARMGV